MRSRDWLSFSSDKDAPLPLRHIRYTKRGSLECRELNMECRGVRAQTIVALVFVGQGPCRAEGRQQRLSRVTRVAYLLLVRGCALCSSAHF